MAEGLAELGHKTWDLEDYLVNNLKFQENSRVVIAATANNESLPFKDESFDCYLASLSLMLVDNHHN